MSGSLMAFTNELNKEIQPPNFKKAFTVEELIKAKLFISIYEKKSKNIKEDQVDEILILIRDSNDNKLINQEEMFYVLKDFIESLNILSFSIKGTAPYGRKEFESSLPIVAKVTSQNSSRQPIFNDLKKLNNTLSLFINASSGQRVNRRTLFESFNASLRILSRTPFNEIPFFGENVLEIFIEQARSCGLKIILPPNIKSPTKEQAERVKVSELKSTDLKDPPNDKPKGFPSTQKLSFLRKMGAGIRSIFSKR